MPKFLPFFPSQSDLFYLLVLGAEGYCCTWSHSTTHTHTISRTPLDGGSARRRDLHLTTRNVHGRQKSMPSAGFGPEIAAMKQPLTHALDRMATGICTCLTLKYKI